MKYRLASEYDKNDVDILLRCLMRCNKCGSGRWVEEDECSFCLSFVHVVTERERQEDEKRLEHISKHTWHQTEKKPKALPLCDVCETVRVSKANANFCGKICSYMSTRMYIEGGVKKFRITREDAETLLAKKNAKHESVLNVGGGEDNRVMQEAVA